MATHVSFTLKSDLPKDVDVDAVDEVLELSAGIDAPMGRTVLLRTSGTWQAFTRPSLFGALSRVALSRPPALRVDGFRHVLVLMTADGQEHALEVPMFEQERAKKLFTPSMVATAAVATAARPMVPGGPDATLEAEIVQALPQGKIHAIKLWRERTGDGLKEARDAVEAIAARVESAPPRPAPAVTNAADPNADLEAEVRLMLPNMKINAIKLWRERTGVGLKEAKDAVEAIALRMDTGAPIASAPPGRATIGELAGEVRRLVALGQKIAAIKHVRERTGLNLNEAKEVVEEMIGGAAKTGPSMSLGVRLVWVLGILVLGGSIVRACTS